MGFEDELGIVPESVREVVLATVEELSRKGFSKEDVWSKMKKLAESQYLINSYSGDPVGLWTYIADATKAIVRRQSGGNATKVDMVIPIGITPVRTTKQGRRSSVFAVVKSEGTTKLSEIVFRGSLALTVDRVNLYKVYNGVILTDRGYFYEANMSTSFDNYTTNVSAKDLLKKIGVRVVKMDQMKNALSRVDDNGYVDRTDLRAFVGYVAADPRKKIDDNIQIAVYDATDNTLEESDVAADGTIVPKYLSVWCHPAFAKYGEGSKLLFVGTLEKRRSDNIVQMNAIYIEPVIVTHEVE